MQEPLVSICCICYNQEQYIRQALDGFVMQQTNFPFEIVISDDCSIDGTRAIIAEYKAKYQNLIRDISPKKNKGSLANWWYVQSEANGKYTAICEGDDYWTDSHKLQKQVDFLETHQDFSMCFHAAEILNESHTHISTTCDKIKEKEYYTNDIFPGWIIPTASVLYRMDLVKKFPPLQHNEWLKYGDIVLFLKCMQVGRVWGMEKRMSIYRMTDNGAVLRQRQEQDYKERMCKHYEALMQNFPLLDKKWPKSYIATYNYSKFRQSKNIIDKLHALYYACVFDFKYVLLKFLKMNPNGIY